MCIDLPACIRASQIKDAIEQVSCFSGTNKGVGGGGWVREGAGGRGRRVRKKRAMFLLTFTPGTLCLDASAEKNIRFR